MLHKTRGIALSYIKYKESSIIARIYTETFGLQAYIVNSVRTKKPRYNIALFQPLTLLNLVAYHKKGADLQRISEIQCAEQYTTIPYSHHKTTMALFIAEALTKTLREEEANLPLFEFIFQSLQLLDHISDGYHNFHLQFLLKLTKYMGVGLTSGNNLFEELDHMPLDPHSIAQERDSLEQLLLLGYKNEIALTNAERRQLLEYLIQYYQRHIDGFGDMRTLPILRQIF